MSTKNGSKIWFEGGNGNSIDEAVIIRGALCDLVGTWAEFQWLTDKLGQKDIAWELVSHSHGMAGRRHIDTVVVRLSSGENATRYFDITESFGKDLNFASF